MKSGVDLARELFEKAENDFRAALIGIEHGAPRDTVCFHVQQAAEKSVKALLSASDLEYPRTHDIGLLLELAAGPFSELAAFADRFDAFGPYAVELRYSADFCPSEQDVLGALALTRELRAAIARLLPATVLPDGWR